MDVRKRVLLVGTVVPLAIIAISPALGCAGEMAATGPSEIVTDATASGTTVEAQFPERLRAVIGRTETATGAYSAWLVTRDADMLKDLPSNHVLATGERGSRIAYSDLATGELYVWHPGESAPADVTSLRVPLSGQVSGDVLALSPDETRLALVRYEQTAGSAAEGEEAPTVAHGFLVDLDAATVERWEWLETVGGGDEVTTLRWNPTSASVYVSFGPGGGSQGDRSYRYDLGTGESAELEGIAAVLDVGPQGQVVGLGVAASSGDLDYPTGSQYGHLPLVAWAESQSVRLPRDPNLATWDSAWISGDGRTIVVRGSVSGGSGESPCLEVLGLGDAGWELRRLFDGGGLLTVLYGVAFGPGTDSFYFQAGTPPGAPGGAVTDVRLYGLDTFTGEVSRYRKLPGADAGRYLQTLSVVGSGGEAGR
jgi:hypothetical protein